MGQGELLEVHMWLSTWFLGIFSLMMVCSYCSTLFTSVHDAGYIMLGIILPITLPALGVACIPCWMRCRRQHTTDPESDQGIDRHDDNDNEDSEKSSFLRN